MQTAVRKDTRDIPVMTDQAEELKKGNKNSWHIAVQGHLV